jgi:hypothetical protein
MGDCPLRGRPRRGVVRDWFMVLYLCHRHGRHSRDRQSRTLLGMGGSGGVSLRPPPHLYAAGAHRWRARLSLRHHVARNAARLEARDRPGPRRSRSGVPSSSRVFLPRAPRPLSGEAGNVERMGARGPSARRPCQRHAGRAGARGARWCPRSSVERRRGARNGRSPRRGAPGDDASVWARRPRGAHEHRRGPTHHVRTRHRIHTHHCGAQYHGAPPCCPPHYLTRW